LTKYQLLISMWHNGYPHLLVVGMQYSIATLEDSFCSFFSLFAVLEIKPRDLCIVGRCSTTCTTPPALFALVYFSDRVSGFLPGTSLGVHPPCLDFFLLKLDVSNFCLDWVKPWSSHLHLSCTWNFMCHTPGTFLHFLRRSKNLTYHPIIILLMFT
jgi:hypothetical protein